MKGRSGIAPGWAFEDAEVGAVIAHPGSRRIGLDEHGWIAMVTSNASDLHLDANQADSSAFGQPVVLGALTVAIVVGLAEPQEWPAAAVGRGELAGWTAIRLGEPVFGGDTIQAESTILAAARTEHGGLVQRRIVGRNQRGEVVATIDEGRLVPLNGR